ncbi:hypothetical protein LINPERPRIM_LOCUS4765 [Linum perenne]
MLLINPSSFLISSSQSFTTAPPKSMSSVASYEVHKYSKKSKSSIAKQAEEEADKTITFNLRDVAAHILEGLSLDLLGFKTSDLESIAVALSPLSIKSLNKMLIKS